MSALPNARAPAIKSKGLPPFYRFTVILGLVFLLLIALVGDKTVDEQGKESGYWGEVTATMDWCERNYVVTPYIAEFYNTISNLGFIGLSLAGIWFHKNCMFFFSLIFFFFFLIFYFFIVEIRYILAYLSVTVTGIGSGLFHGTLLYSMQLCDELPMFYVIFMLYEICVYHYSIPSKTYYDNNGGLFKGIIKNQLDNPKSTLTGIGIVLFSYIYYLYPFPTLFQLW